MTSASFKHALSQLLLPPAIAQAILACVLALLVYALESSATRVDHTDQVLSRMNKLTRLMIDEETGVRGYLLTGRKEFLEPYNLAKLQIDPAFQQLQQLVIDPLQIERIRKLSADNDAWEAFATSRLAATRTREELVADSFLAKARMDQIRGKSDQFIETEEVLRTRSSSSYARFRSRTTYILLPLLAVLAAALIFMFTRRMFSKLAKMQAWQSWLNTTLRGIGDAVIACDPGGKVVFMNEVAEALTGWTEDEARGRPLPEVFQIVNEDTRAIVESPADKVLRLGTVVWLESHTVLVRKDGSEIAVDDSGAPVREPHGSLTGVVTVFRDASERRALEYALQQSATEARARAAELEAIMQVVPAVVFTAHDTKCERVTSSLLAYKLLGLQPDKYTSFAPSEQRPQHYRVMRNGRELAPEESPLQTVAATGCEVRDFELTLAFDDGSSRDIFGNAVPLFDDSGAVRGAVAAFIDITDRKLAEETLRKTEKLAVVGRLAASLSHEINNPLESVTNLLYLVETASSMEHIREYTKMAQQELVRVSTIATQTLLFYRQSSRPSAVSVAKLLDSAISLYGRRFSSAGISIERRYEDVASLFAYDGELRQVFVNLIGNAFDATRNVGTRVIVRERQVLNCKTGIKGIRITIADTGQGMSPATLKRLFEPFFSTKGDTGTGLGLWITKGIVDKHRGSMLVRNSQSPQNQGTVFSIFFPFEGISFEALSRAASATH